MISNIASSAASRIAQFTPEIPIPGVPDVGELLKRGASVVGGAIIDRALDGLGALGREATRQVRDQIADWAGQIKDQLAALPSQAANALADSMRGPNARTLTAGEQAAVRHAFGNSIDLSNVRIVDGPGRNPDAWTAFNVGGNPAITEGNTVYIGQNYSSDFSRSPEGIRTLVHEFTHVRQFQQLGFGSFAARYAGDLANARGNRNEPYDYASRTTAWRNEPLEGQAQMVGDYAMYKAGGGNLTTAQAASIERRLAGTGIFGF
ncbi:MAG: DUF4157 domain-containing protein [Parasphingorhabdus sp.]|nr:DUF4157 domain-containing protein [Parasphingorhabdus sp.]